MALPLAAIMAGASAIGGMQNMAMQHFTNVRNRKFAREMYGRQRQDALADFAMQNQYNHPSSQMARLREAGLNPNLVYKGGADGNNSTAIRSSSAPAASADAPQFDVGSVIGAYTNTATTQAQLDNLRVQNSVLTQEALLKSAQTVATLTGAENTGTDTLKKRFDLDLANTLKQTSVDAAKAQLQKTQTETNIAMDANERAAAQNSMSLREALERIANMRATRKSMDIGNQKTAQEIRNLINSSKLQELDLNLKKVGVQPSDNIFLRVLTQILSRDGQRYGDPLKGKSKRYQDSLIKDWQGTYPFSRE